METFYRDYRLTVGIGNQAVIIEPPMSVSFKTLESVDKKSLGKLSVIVDNLDKLITTFKDNKRVNRHKDLEVVGSNEDDIVL